MLRSDTFSLKVLYLCHLEKHNMACGCMYIQVYIHSCRWHIAIKIFFAHLLCEWQNIVVHNVSTLCNNIIMTCG